MTRSDADSWNLSASVGATATMVAAARAAASKRASPVMQDPLAEALVCAVGAEPFAQLARGTLDFGDLGSGWMPDEFAARACFYDSFLTRSSGYGIRQIVILASGLDTRAYRLTWPSEATIYEVDQPEVVAFKEAALSHLGATPAAQLCFVGIDLRDDWPFILQRKGFNAKVPTAWIAEGLLLGYLRADDQDRLLSRITSLSAPLSRLALDHIPTSSESIEPRLRVLAERSRERGFEIAFGSPTFASARNNAKDVLRENGWFTGACTRTDIHRLAGLPAPTLEDHSGPPVIEYVLAERI